MHLVFSGATTPNLHDIRMLVAYNGGSSFTVPDYYYTEGSKIPSKPHMCILGVQYTKVSYHLSSTNTEELSKNFFFESNAWSCSVDEWSDWTSENFDYSSWFLGW